MEAPPDYFCGKVHYSMVLEEDLSFLGRGGRTVSLIKNNDLRDVHRISPHVVILMVGGNDLTNPARSPHEVASDIHALALSILEMELCYLVLVGGIPPRVTYPWMDPTYPDRVQHCNFILRNLLEVEENISCFKLRGLVNPDDKVHIPD